MTRLLIIDDDAAVVAFLTEELSTRYEITGEVSPVVALALIERDSFDLVIADIEMPEMRGTELLAAIHRRRPDQLVLMITAFGSIELAVETVRDGACDFVAKPFTIARLVTAIEQALARPRPDTKSLAEVEMGHIKRVLAQNDHNMTRTAKILGIDRRTLYRKLDDESER